MTSSEDYLDSLLAGVNDQLNSIETEKLKENEINAPSENEQEGLDFDLSDLENLQAILEDETENIAEEQNILPDADDDLQEETLPSDEILQEEFVDMDEIEAILKDVADVHPDRDGKSSDELSERITKYEENPELAEKALLGDDEEEKNDQSVTENSESNEEDSTTSEEINDENDVDDDDILAGLEDVDALLKEVEEKANEESEQIAKQIADGEDKDIDDINALLSKSDNNEAVSDNLLSMIEGLDEGAENEGEDLPEEEPENENPEEGEKEKKKKKKKEKKNKKEDEKDTDDSKSKEKTPEKKGLFAKLLGLLTDGDDEEEENPSEEKKEEKGKKDKKKDKKGAKKGKATADDNASIEAELDEEDKNSKGKKGKKDKKDKGGKKDKGAKKEKKEKGNEEEEKSFIKKQGIIVAFLFCFTILGIVLFCSVIGPKVLARNEARVAYYRGDYETASNKLYGMKLSESDSLIYKKASLLYRLQLFKEKADAYEKSGERKAYLDALLETHAECSEVYVDAKFLSITEEVDVFRTEIETRLYDNFGLTPDEITEINAMRPVYYTMAVNNILDGKPYSENSSFVSSDEIEEQPDQQEETVEELKDLLPEETEIQNGRETEE